MMSGTSPESPLSKASLKFLPLNNKKGSIDVISECASRQKRQMVEKINIHRAAVVGVKF